MHMSVDGAAQMLPADWHKWIILEGDLHIAQKEDGSDHLLGLAASGAAVYKGFLRGEALPAGCGYSAPESVELLCASSRLAFGREVHWTVAPWLPSHAGAYAVQPGRHSDTWPAGSA